MGLTLNFRAIPAPLYHTLNFHLNRGVKDKIYASGLNEEGKSLLMHNLSGILRKMIQIPDHFSICILPAKLYASTILKGLFPPGIHLISSYMSNPSFNHEELSFSGMEEKVLLPDTSSENIPGLKRGCLLIRDADPVSGLIFKFPEFLSTHSDNPAIHICLDISTSLINHTYDYERVDSYLFNSEFVFGFQPGITVLLTSEPVLERIRHEWVEDFISPEGIRKTDHPDILCYREVDPLRLFVFNEMCNDFLRRDPKIIRNEIIYKSILIANALDRSESFELIINKETDRSHNIISARLLGSIERVRNHFNQCGIRMDEIYVEDYGYIFRFGNYPVHSKEQAEYLTDCMASL